MRRCSGNKTCWLIRQYIHSLRCASASDNENAEVHFLLQTRPNGIHMGGGATECAYSLSHEIVERREANQLEKTDWSAVYELGLTYVLHCKSLLIKQQGLGFINQSERLNNSGYDTNANIPIYRHCRMWNEGSNLSKTHKLFAIKSLQLENYQENANMTLQS